MSFATVASVVMLFASKTLPQDKSFSAHLVLVERASLPLYLRGANNGLALIQKRFES